MKIKSTPSTPFCASESLPLEAELDFDPLAGTAGYRVQTDLQAGNCDDTNDGCSIGTQMGRDLKGNNVCVACQYGAP